MLVFTSRYGEETALRALRYFASFAFNVSLFLKQIPCAKLAKYRKARGAGVASEESRPYKCPSSGGSVSQCGQSQPNVPAVSSPNTRPSKTNFRVVNQLRLPQMEFWNCASAYALNDTHPTIRKT